MKMNTFQDQVKTQTQVMFFLKIQTKVKLEL